jgi:hypothetical protein
MKVVEATAAGRQVLVLVHKEIQELQAELFPDQRQAKRRSTHD